MAPLNGSPGRGRHARSSVIAPHVVDALLVVVVPAVTIAALYLAPFARDPGLLPFGNDTYKYIWRTNLVFEEGIEQLTEEGTGINKPLGERPSHPIALSVLRATTGAPTLSIMWVLPAVLAAAVALAASVFASDTAGERRRVAGLVGIGVAGSAFIAWTAVGYSTNLAFDVAAIGVAALAIRAGFGGRRREAVGAGLLLGGGALYHWLFAGLFGALLLGFASLLVIGRVVLRGPSRPTGRAAIRLVTVVAVAAAVGAIGFWLAPELPKKVPIAKPGHVVFFTELRLPAMALAVTLPLAGLGAFLMLFGRRDDARRRWSVGVLVPWAAFALVGLIGWYALDRAVLPYRWAGFALGIPFLIVLGALAIAYIRPAPVTRPIGWTLAVAATVWLAASGASVWWSQEPKSEPGLFSQLETVSRYLATIPSSTDVVVVGFPNPSRLWAGLPPSVFDRIEFAPLELIEAVPDLGRDTPFVALFIEAIAHRPEPSWGTNIGPGVSVLRGPPATVTPGPPTRSPPPLQLAALTAACLGILMLAGVGWARALTELPVVGVIGIAPAFGLVLLGLLGLAADRLGVPLGGAGGVAVVVATTLFGWLLAAGLRRRRTAEIRPRHTAGPEAGPLDDPMPA